MRQKIPREFLELISWSCWWVKVIRSERNSLVPRSPIIRKFSFRPASLVDIILIAIERLGNPLAGQRWPRSPALGASPHSYPPPAVSSSPRKNLFGPRFYLLTLHLMWESRCFASARINGGEARFETVWIVYIYIHIHRYRFERHDGFFKEFSDISRIKYWI